jgi:hypothetical protein
VLSVISVDDGDASTGVTTIIFAAPIKFIRMLAASRERMLTEIFARRALVGPANVPGH